MKNKKTNPSLLGILPLFILSHFCNAALCSFELPPNEHIVLNGNLFSSKTLVCEVDPKSQNKENQLNFISEKNTSIINNLIMPEGTIMSMSFSSVLNDVFTFELEPEGKLGITNDTSKFIRLTCNQS